MEIIKNVCLLMEIISWLNTHFKLNKWPRAWQILIKMINGSKVLVRVVQCTHSCIYKAVKNTWITTMIQEQCGTKWTKIKKNQCCFSSKIEICRRNWQNVAPWGRNDFPDTESSQELLTHTKLIVDRLKHGPTIPPASSYFTKLLIKKNKVGV